MFQNTVFDSISLNDISPLANCSMALSGRPKNWPHSNYDDPPTRGLPAAFIFICGITAVVVILRLYSRRYLTNSLGIDDGLLLAGFV